MLSQNSFTKSFLLAVCFFLPLLSIAEEIYEQFPEEIHPGQRYVIYSHGFIVEGIDPRPAHPEYGVYTFPAIKLALFDNANFNLIAQQRPANTDIDTYVNTLVSWVRRLMDAGVPAQRISLVGFSRGANLTARASSRLRSSGINTAIMAACLRGDIEVEPALILGGDVLSIYETSDIAGTCADLAERSKTTAYREIAINTGLKHGAFYRPIAAWLGPLQAWIQASNR